jgi:transposase
LEEMPAPLKISLSEEEDRTLRELSYANYVPQRVKQRASALRLNASGWKVQQIAQHFDWATQTVRETIHRWQERGLGGLGEAEGRGRHRCWNQEDWQALEQWVNEPRRYSAAQLSYKLAQERQVELGKEQVRRILKKTLQLETDSIKSARAEHKRSLSSQARRLGDVQVVGRVRNGLPQIP